MEIEYSTHLEFEPTLEEQPVAFGFVKSDKIYLKGWGKHQDREIGEVRDGDLEKSVQFFVERFEEFEKKVEDLIQNIEATENKGSFLMKLVHLKEQLPKHDGLGDYQRIHDRLDKYESLIKDIIHKNRLRNTDIKKALLLEAEEIGQILNWKEATEKANDLKSRWIKTGSADEENQEQLEHDFWSKIQNFYDRKKRFFEDKQKLIDRREEQYSNLVKEAEKIDDFFGKARFEKVKDLKERWKEVGGIPAEKYQPLYEKFKQLTGRKVRPPQQVDYSPIIEMLEEVKSGKAPYSKKELDLIKKNLLKDRKRSDEKKKALDLIQLIIEKEFVLNLARKRFVDYSKMDAAKKQHIKTGIVRDLISRDKEELQTYEENSANFSSSDGSLIRLVSNKIYNQKKKIALKEQLLEMILRGEF